MRPRGHGRVRADAPCFTPGNFKKNATVRPSHGRPRGHRPIVRPFVRKRPRDNHGMDVTPESRVVHGPKDTRKGKSPGKKDRDVIMTSASKEVESGSGGEGFPIPDLHQRHGMQAFSPDQETAGFRIPSLK
jgi:hypothetical protein